MLYTAYTLPFETKGAAEAADLTTSSESQVYPEHPCNPQAPLTI